jgi:hypothetical protein
MTPREEFRAYMKTANRTSGNYDDGHLSEAQMIAFCRGEIGAADRETAEAHLVGCEQCGALFRNARDFLDPTREDEEEVGKPDITEAWRSLWARARTEAPPNAGAIVAQADFQSPKARKPSFDWRVAWWRPVLAFAVLALIAVALIYLFSGKRANKPPEFVQEKAPPSEPSSPHVDQSQTAAQDKTTPTPIPPEPAPSHASEQVLATNIKARRGTGFDDSATRGEREDAARASLLTARRILLDMSGDNRSRTLLNNRLIERLSASGRFALAADRQEAEAALKIAIEAPPVARTDATPDQRISFTARVVGADGKTLWPIAPRVSARRYEGPAPKAADRMIGDLLGDVQRLERKQQ